MYEISCENRFNSLLNRFSRHVKLWKQIVWFFLVYEICLRYIIWYQIRLGSFYSIYLSVKNRSSTGKKNDSIRFFGETCVRTDFKMIFYGHLMCICGATSRLWGAFVRLSVEGNIKNGITWSLSALQLSSDDRLICFCFLFTASFDGEPTSLLFRGSSFFPTLLFTALGRFPSARGGARQIEIGENYSAGRKNPYGFDSGRWNSRTAPLIAAVPQFQHLPSFVITVFSSVGLVLGPCGPGPPRQRIIWAVNKSVIYRRMGAQIFVFFINLRTTRW